MVGVVVFVVANYISRAMAYSPRLILADLLKSYSVAPIALVHRNVVRVDATAGWLPWSQQIGIFFDGSHFVWCR